MQSSAAYQLVQLGNGTYSIHSVSHRETFHPVIGPVAEAEALYVEQLRLAERLQGHEGEFVVWDVGLGAAANALAVLRRAERIPCRIRLLSFDETLEPLRFALQHASQLGYMAGYDDALAALATGAGSPVRISREPQTVTWELHLGDFPALLKKPEAARFPKPHAILFDAYSPTANPAMWTLPLFSHLYQLLDAERPCALPTYSRSTLLRTTLLLAGFFVGKGHATGEKEETTLAANTLNLIAEPLDLRWLKRVRNSTSAEPLQEAVYRQAPLSSAHWAQLQQHPQFASATVHP